MQHISFNDPEYLLQDARDYVKNNLDDGIICPCCNKYTRRYKRKFNSTMARSLLWLVKTYLNNKPYNFIDVPKDGPRWLVRSNQLATIRWWDLAQRPINEDNPDLKHSGLWKPTEKGINFVFRRIRIPEVAVTYDGNLQELSGNLVSIEDTLGTKFSYAEIMGIEKDGQLPLFY